MINSSPKFNGDPTVESLASGLATLGRYGDEYMVHASEGETMIPAEVFEANPGLRDALFWQMKMMGIKDPSRFVVGNAMNSINPITGQPEFWFHKKIWKAVKKVFKKAAPIIAPIIGNMIMPGLGGLIASALVTKLQGGSWGDVLKGAAIGMVTQGVMGGIGSMGPGGQGFMSGFGKGISAPFQAGSNLFSSGPSNPFSQGIFGTAGAANQPGAGIFGKIFRQYDPNAQFAANMPAAIAARGGQTYTSPQGSTSKMRYEGRIGQQNVLDEIASGGFEGSDAGIASLQTTPYEDVNFFRHSGGDGDFLMDARPGSSQDLLTKSRYGTGPNSYLKSGRLGPRLQRPGLSPQQQIALINEGTPSQQYYDPDASVIRGTQTASGEYLAPDSRSLRGMPVETPLVTSSQPGADLYPGDDWAPVLDPTQYPRGEIIMMPSANPNAAGTRFEVVSPGSSGGGEAFIGPDGKIVPAGSQAAVGAQEWKKYTDPAMLDFGITPKVEGALAPVVGPDLAKTIAGQTGLVTTGAALTGAYFGAEALGWLDDDPKDRPDPNKPGSAEYIAYDDWRKRISEGADPNSAEMRQIYWKWHGTPYVTRSLFERNTGGKSNKPDWWFLPEGASSEAGSGYEGGGEVMGAGTGTSDSIPARLSDGEFVMTADAVRNAGDGNRNLGAARMYDMMRRFEGRAA
jgi:hypothetical protein